MHDLQYSWPQGSCGFAFIGDHAQRTVLTTSTLPLPFARTARASLSHLASSALGATSDARVFVLLPMATLAGLAAIVRDLALGATAQRGTPTLFLAEAVD